MEPQRDGRYRATLYQKNVTTPVTVRNIPTRELAEEVTRALREAYEQGRNNFRPRVPWADPDYDYDDD